MLRIPFFLRSARLDLGVFRVVLEELRLRNSSERQRINADPIMDRDNCDEKVGKKKSLEIGAPKRMKSQHARELFLKNNLKLGHMKKSI